MSQIMAYEIFTGEQLVKDSLPASEIALQLSGSEGLVLGLAIKLFMHHMMLLNDIMVIEAEQEE